MLAWLVIFALTGGAVLLAYLYATRRFKYWSNKGVAGPTPSFFFGNVGTMMMQSVSPGEYLRDLYEKVKGHPISGFFILDRPALLLRDPEVIKHVLIKDFVHFVNRYSNSSVESDPLAARGMFIMKGRKWKELRSTLSPTFTSGRMKQMFHLVLDCATELKSYITDVSKSGASIEVKELLAKTSTDVITSCAFGINSNCLRDPQAEFREFGRKITQYSTFRSVVSTSSYFMPWVLQVFHLAFFPKDVANFLRRVFWEAMDTREKNNTTRNDFIDLLIQLKNKGKIEDLDSETSGTVSADAGKVEINGKSKTFDFNGDDLLAQAAVFFLGGFETTASTASFTLYELALAPGIQTRLRQEIREVLALHGGRVTYQAMNEMKYLDMVVSETLRKYPSLPFLDRECVQDYVIPGTNIKIEKGTPIYIPLLGLHYDPEYFPEPEKYDPERFSEDLKHSRPSCVYLPFGDGPRMCVGMRFGLMTTKTELIQMLTNFEVIPCAETPVPIKLHPKSALMATTKGIPLLFRPIK